MTVNLVTNADLDEISGGFSGMNRAAWDLIAGAHDAKYIGPVNPQPARSGMKDLKRDG